MALIQKPAPDFTAPAVLGDGSIDEEFSLSDLKGRYVVLFFYLLDFTYVCPTEILALDRRLDDFRARDAEVVGISVDSQFSHLAWRATPVANGGVGAIRFPLVSDLTKQISRDYGVLLEERGVALRGTFLIDREGVVRHGVINDLGLGRNVDEVLRMVDALRHHEAQGEVCPANWTPGDEAMTPSPEGLAKYLSNRG